MADDQKSGLPPRGRVGSRPTVDRDSDNGAGWLIAIAFVLAAIAGVYFLSQGQSGHRAANEAVPAPVPHDGAPANKGGGAAEDDDGTAR